MLHTKLLSKPLLIKPHRSANHRAHPTKRHLVLFLSALLVLLAGSKQAGAGMIVVGDFSGSETVLDFESLTDGELITNQFAPLGIVFVNPDVGFDVIARNRTFGIVANVEQGGGSSGVVAPLELQFSVPVNKVGMDIVFGSVGFGIMYTLEIFDSLNTLLDSTTLSLGAFGFIGLESSTTIAKATITGIGSNLQSFNLNIDNVRFEATVPEPSTLTLWSLGAIALGGVGWRRRRRRNG